MKITKNKIIALALIIIILAVAFWYGGGAPGLQGWNVSQTPKDIISSDDNAIENTENTENLNNNDKKSEAELKQDSELSTNSSSLDNNKKNDENSENKVNNENNKNDKSNKDAGNSDKKNDSAIAKEEKSKTDTQTGLSASEKVELAKKLAGGNSSAGVEEGSKSYSESQGMIIDSTTGKDKYLTDPVPEGKPIPVEPQNAAITDVERTCTLSVRCDTILDNMDWLDKEKVELVPEDGVIFATKTVTFYEGESVFNVLQREMKKAKIHMEFANTPMYNSVYIEGINNLYEFDCGELSGWMYKVNNWFPNYGCSRYQLKEGDVIEWVYTCNLGVDVGGFYSVGD